MRKLNIDLSRIHEIINTSFYPLLFDTNPYLIFRGGAGSGKSVFCAQKILFRILMDYNSGFKHRFLALKKTAPFARRSLFPMFKEMISEWGLNGICDINKTNMVFTFSNGSQIDVMGLDESEKVKSISGVTGIFMEEGTEFTYEDFMQLDLRMRGKIGTYYQIMGAFNPTSKLSWLYKEFYENEMRYGDLATLHLSTYMDNRFLDEQYKTKLKSLGDRDYGWYKIYCLGEWGSLENVIYRNWETVEGFPSDITDITLGLDFGFNHPSALVMTGITKDNTYVKELLYQSKLTVSKLVERMKKIIPDDNEAQLNRQLPIYCDNARPEAIKQIREAGFNAIAVIKGKNSVKEGIDTVKQQDLLITTRSTNIINEIQKYKWREDKDGNVFEEPFKHDDDAMDAIRYSLFMRLRKKIECGVLFASL